MSTHFDMVINCDLREDVPTSCIEFISWLCDVNADSEFQPESDCFNNFHHIEKEMAENFDHPFLASRPDNEIISLLQRRYRFSMPANTGRRDVYHYCLQFSAHDLAANYFFECHLVFIHWIAPIIEDGFIGYYKERLAVNPTLMYVKDGKLVTINP